MAKNRVCFGWCTLDPAHPGDCKREDALESMTKHRTGNGFPIDSDDPHDLPGPGLIERAAEGIAIQVALFTKDDIWLVRQMANSQCSLKAGAKKQLDAIAVKMGGPTFEEESRSVGYGEQELADNAIDTRDRDPNTRQVGGTHYGLGKIQHWDLAVMFGWNWAQYQITKYVMRYLQKNGLQDLEKAQHFLEKLIAEIRAGRMPEKNS